MFAAIACSNGWDDVTAALQLLSHLDGDAGVPAGGTGSFDELPVRTIRSSRAVSTSISSDGLSVELETLARRAFADIDSSIQLQMVGDQFIDGQAHCGQLSCVGKS